MPSFEMPHEVSVEDAIKIIAQQSPASRHSGMGHGPKLTRPEMVTLARTACRTEKISYEGFTKEGA